MKLKINEYTYFDDIKHISEYGEEYWEARELMKVLEYSKWERFNNVIENAKIACEKSGNIVIYHFPKVGKMINLAK